MNEIESRRIAIKTIVPLLWILVLGQLPSVAHGYCFGNDKLLPTYDPTYYSVPKEFDRAIYVVTARVIDGIWLDEHGKNTVLSPPFVSGTSRPLGLDPYMGAYYDVQVLRVFKGMPEGRLRLFSDNSSGRFPMDIGADYLLFIGNDTFDVIGQQLDVDNCGNSAPTKEARAQISLREVEDLSRSQ